MKIFRTKKHVKNIWGRINSLNWGVKILGLLIILLLTVSISATSLKLETKSATNAVVLKILHINVADAGFIRNILANQIINYNGQDYVFNVTVISFGDFNTLGKNWDEDYDGFAFGFADGNGDITANGKQYILSIIAENKPVVIGHDSILKPGWKDLMYNNFKMTSTPKGCVGCPGYSNWDTTTWYINSTYKNENVLKIPYDFSSKNTINTYNTHTQREQFTSKVKRVITASDGGVYLGILGSFAYTQIGHTKKASNDEKKLFVNMLFSQFEEGGTLPPPPECPPTGGDVYEVTNEYNFEYKGVSIHTKVLGPDGVSATVRSGETVTFTLTVNNPEATKKVDVKFTLPPGFTYQGGMVYNKISGCSVSVPAVDKTGPMNWTGCDAQAENSTIKFNAKAP